MSRSYERELLGLGEWSTYEFSEPRQVCGHLSLFEAFLFRIYGQLWLPSFPDVMHSLILKEFDEKTLV